MYHSIRAQHHRLVLQELEDASRLVKNVQAQTCLKSLCDNVSECQKLTSLQMIPKEISFYVFDLQATLAFLLANALI